MEWANSGRGLRLERLHRARAARRSCQSLGLVVVDRVWPDGNLWADPNDPRLTKLMQDKE